MNKNKTYRIGIDCRFWGVEHAGLGRYTRELVLEVIRSNKKNVNFVLFFRGDEWRKDRHSLTKCQIIETGVPHYSVIQEQFGLKKIIEREELDLMHFTHFNVPVFLTTPFIVTIHDLIKHFFKGRPVTTHSFPVYWAKYGGYRYVIGQAVKRSRAIIVPSYFTKDQVAVHYQNVEDKIKVIYEGVREPFTSQSNPSPEKVEKVLNKYKLSKPYFIYTGSAYASKNVGMLLAALKHLVEDGKDVSLLIACARNYFWDKLARQVAEMGLSDRVLLPGMVPDEDLVILYKSSIAFVMPSLMEGFGLPALEAMASGAVVLSSNTGSLPEIYGRSAVYFNPTNTDKIAACLSAAIMLDAKQRTGMIKKGQEHARGYQWEKAAMHTAEVYTKVLSES